MGEYSKAMARWRKQATKADLSEAWRTLPADDPKAVAARDELAQRAVERQRPS